PENQHRVMSQTVRPRAEMPRPERDKPPPPLAGAKWRCYRHPPLRPCSHQLA
uniref:Uncharacterized protein n=1 Tax=Aegilops tauschii subsp. strangulata TaxID=200361 RepID=A0A453FQF5_AEGTS